MSIDADIVPDAGVGDHPAGVRYRYPGSPPFQDTELDRRLFRGRAEEADTVLHSILSADLFLLYAVSGMGKTSVLNAGVMHQLRARGHWPVSVRLNDTSKQLVVEIREQIEDAADADPEIELLSAPGEDGEEGATGRDANLWELLASLEVWRANDLQRLVVVFDQFEELFTLGWPDAERAEFISQFGEVVRGHRHQGPAGPHGLGTAPPAVKFVLVIREDSLGELEALATEIPQIMRNRFRLVALDPVQAAAAIREPARVTDGRLDSQPFAYTEAAIQEILDFLRTTTVRGEAVRSSQIDPPQLQIVCQYVERAILPTKAAPPPGDVVQIDAPDLGGREGLERILGDFYRRTLQTFPASQQKAVRELCERGLINPTGRRISLEEGEIGDGFGVTPGMLHQLVDERLLRADPRVGSVYYELAHDTLVPPIRAFTEEDRTRRRRRRRRWIALGAAVLAVAVVALLAYTVGSSDSSDALPGAVRLSPGQTLRNSVDVPGEDVRFTAQADEDQTLVAIVRPVAGVAQEAGDASESGGGLNAAIELTTSDGAKRQQDQLGVGQREQMVVAPVSGDRQALVVTSFDSTSGPFEIILQEQAVTDVAAGSAEPGSISAPGALAVFRVEIRGGSPLVVDIEPTLGSGDQGDRGQAVKQGTLDIEAELVDPAGVGTRIDTLGPGEGERVQVSGVDGQYLIVVRGYQSSIGQFTLEASQVSRELTVGQPETGEIDGTDVAEFTHDLSESGSYVGVTLTSGAGFDAVLDVVDPNGVSAQIDSAGEDAVEIALIGPEPGHYLLDVTGYDSSAGAFTLEATVLDQTLVADQPQSGEVIGADPVPFVLEVPEDSPPLILTVVPDPTFDPQLGIVGPNGEVQFVDDQGDGGTEVALVSAGGGAYLVGVAGFDSSTGSFEVVASPAASETLAPGDRVSASGSMLFEVATSSGQAYELTADPSSPDTSVVIHVQDGGGYSIDYSSGEAGQPVGILADGEVADTYRVLVIPSGGTGDYTVTLTDQGGAVE